MRSFHEVWERYCRAEIPKDDFGDFGPPKEVIEVDIEGRIRGKLVDAMSYPGGGPQDRIYCFQPEEGDAMLITEILHTDGFRAHNVDGCGASIVDDNGTDIDQGS